MWPLDKSIENGTRARGQPHLLSGEASLPVFMERNDPRSSNWSGSAFCGAAQARLALPAPERVRAAPPGSVTCAACRHGHANPTCDATGQLGKRAAGQPSETAMAARSATPDFGDDGVDEVDGRFPEPVAEPRSDADDPPALTSGFFGRRKVVPPIGEAKTPTSTKSRTSQAEEKLEEMLESGKHFLEGLGTGRHGVKRQDTLDKNYWLSLEDEASKSKQFGSHPDLILKQKNRKKCRLRSIEQCEFPKSLKDKNLWVLNPQNRYSWDLTILVLIILVMVLAQIILMMTKKKKKIKNQLKVVMQRMQLF